MTLRKLNTIALVYGLVLNEKTVTGRVLDQIRRSAPQARLVVLKNMEDWNRMSAEDASAVEVFIGLRLESWIDKFPNLQWGQLTSAGADRVMQSKAVVESDVVVTNASGVHAVPIAEHILALIFTFSRDIHHHMRSQLSGKWHRGGRVVELEGTTLGVIGVGKIGEKTAEKAKRLGMKVLGVRRHPEKGCEYVDRMYAPEELHQMLGRCDWVALTAAGTRETRGMIGEPELKAMKESAVIVNIARGSMIQEAHLVAALQDGSIAGAGLDVFETEPLPEDSPLWKMENVVITPHVAGATPHYVERLLDIFTANLKRYQAGEPLKNVVDKQLGY